MDRSTAVDVTGLSSDVAAISGKNVHTCALTTAGGVKCWGVNRSGQLADGTSIDRNTPVDVTGLSSGVDAVSAGGSHTCALTTEGGVKCWGLNRSGLLGDGTTANRNTPVDVTGLSSGVDSVAAGSTHTCALTTAGGLKCWGFNRSGQLGDGTTIDRNTPVDVTGLTSGVAAVAVGSTHTCALTNAGGVKCWGTNLGMQEYGTFTTPVDLIGFASRVAAVSMSGSHTCAVTTRGGLNCWGQNNSGQLGDGTLFYLRTTPMDVIGFLGAGLSIELSASAEVVTVGDILTYTIKVTNNGPATFTGVTLIDTLPASMDFVSAISTRDICTETEGTVTCDIGELGVGAVATANIVVIPTVEDKIINTATVAAVESDPMLEKNTATEATFVVRAFAPATSTAVFAGTFHTCAVTTAGGVKCWGVNRSGQLGDGTRIDRNTPVDVVGLTGGVADVAAGSANTCALTTAGGVKCWGANHVGQLGHGTTTNRATPVNVTALSSGVAAISVGGNHTCALTTAGGVKCWGLGHAGQLGDGTGDGTVRGRSNPVDVTGLTSGVAAISAGFYHTCALSTAGVLKCWGLNDNGQLGDGTFTNRTTPVDVLGLPLWPTSR